MGHFYSITRPNPGHIYDSEITGGEILQGQYQEKPPNTVKFYSASHYGPNQSTLMPPNIGCFQVVR